MNARGYDRLAAYRRWLAVYEWLDGRDWAPEMVLRFVRRRLDRIWYRMTDWEKDKARPVRFRVVT